MRKPNFEQGAKTITAQAKPLQTSLKDYQKADNKMISEFYGDLILRAFNFAISD